MDMPADQVICFRQGEYDVMVDGKLYGTWDSREVAEVGLLVEQRRAAARKTKAAAT
jgi:hypothetical protein